MDKVEEPSKDNVKNSEEKRVLRQRVNKKIIESEEEDEEEEVYIPDFKKVQPLKHIETAKDIVSKPKILVIEKPVDPDQDILFPSEVKTIHIQDKKEEVIT